jgi:hypothetical protein
MLQKTVSTPARGEAIPWARFFHLLAARRKIQGSRSRLRSANPEPCLLLILRSGPSFPSNYSRQNASLRLMDKHGFSIQAEFQTQMGKG